ncbi:hypothetical protein [Sulfurimonas sp.]|uniref:hypothetical protein n=1 Tax=Sulfurimonas sp. TaxID=2022749 RepID=UPI0025E75959|nr:hypothetical protein [Sulfurimonas sp.]
MQTNILNIIKTHIVGEFFSASHTLDNTHAFDFFLNADIDWLPSVNHSAFGTEWGYTVCEQYEDENVRGIRNLMRSQLEDLLKLQDTIKESNVLDCSIEDVEDDERIMCELNLTAFEIARLGRDALYRMAEEKFMKVGLCLEVSVMHLIPIKIEEHTVTYNAIPISYVRTWSNGDISKHINNECITPLFESLLTFNEGVECKHCPYDSKTLIMLPQSFDTERIDKRMCELKTNVATYRDKIYLVGVRDSGYALWECEVK